MGENTDKVEIKENLLTDEEVEDYFEQFKKVSLRKPSSAAIIFGGQVYSYSKLLRFVESF